MGHKIGQHEITHETTLPHEGDELRVSGWENPLKSGRWILNVSLLTDLKPPYDRLTFPATVEGSDFDDAAQLAIIEGVKKYRKWRENG